MTTSLFLTHSFPNFANSAQAYRHIIYAAIKRTGIFASDLLC
jgi:hypothetical protein